MNTILKSLFLVQRVLLNYRKHILFCSVGFLLPLHAALAQSDAKTPHSAVAQPVLVSPITTHVLDISRGRPAAGVKVTLAHQIHGSWVILSSRAPDENGRIQNLLPSTQQPEPGVYKLTFAVGPYFTKQGIKAFYSDVPIEFEIRATGEHYHVPLLLSPFGYSTYRGS